MSPDHDKCGSYHHGDLRNTLIIAAAALIEKNGSLDFAMVDAARQAGVSSAAPYRHFKDKDALLEAVSDVAFLALTHTTRDAANRFPAGSTDSLIATGRSYLAFVTEHPQFYDLMWGDIGLRARTNESFNTNQTGFQVLVEVVGAWCEAHSIEDYDALELSVRLWSIAHGLACLAMNGHLERFLPDSDMFAFFESSTHTFLNGLRHRT
tara:strand:- start:196935 stop:197558 length:624 start_codon:yes stop_codon:yes gene_type:complete